jgi:hypothetical protein
MRASTYGNDEVVPLGLLAHGEVKTVEKLVLEDTDGVGVADGPWRPRKSRAQRP